MSDENTPPTPKTAAIPPPSAAKTSAVPLKKETVRITLTDNGSGIAPEHLPRLFEPLFTTKTRGLGLGLAISREIIERHGGKISVASALGSGTTFTITLPVTGGCDHE